VSPVSPESPVTPVTPAGPTQEELDQQAVQQAKDDGKTIYRNVVARYEKWPDSIPPGGDFAEDRAAYDAAVAEAERQRTLVNTLYGRLNSATTPAAARGILSQMKAAQSEHIQQSRKAKAAVDAALAKERARTNLREWAWNNNPSKLNYAQIREDNGNYVDMVCNTTDEMNRGFRCQPTSGGMGVVERCTQPGAVWGCNAWERVQMKLRDFSLVYAGGTSNGRWQTYPARDIRQGEQDMTMSPDKKTVYMVYTKDPYKLDEHEMGVEVKCRYGEATGYKWVAEYATLRKGLAQSSDNFSVSVKGGFKPFGVGVEISGSYGHAWNHFRHGKPKLASGFPPGSECR
jgi:hypothetical protein